MSIYDVYERIKDSPYLSVDDKERLERKHLEFLRTVVAYSTQIPFTGKQTNIFGDVEYFEEGVKSRFDGPAVIKAKGPDEWWFKGTRVMVPDLRKVLAKPKRPLMPL